MTKRLSLCVVAAAVIGGVVPAVRAQIAAGNGVAGMNVDKVVELELLTSSEVTDKIKNDFNATVQRYPHVPTNAPDPYQPPKM